jgi:hypothetical protein
VPLVSARADPQIHSPISIFGLRLGTTGFSEQCGTHHPLYSEKAVKIFIGKSIFA